MVNVLRDGYVKTRKPHKCHGCQEIIPTGTTVYHQTCIYDGIYTIYMCDACQEWCSQQGRDRVCQDCPENEMAFEGYVKECKQG